MSFPAYESYRDSGVSWVGDVPSCWGIARLGFEAETLVPMRDKPNELTGPIPWVRIEDFTGKYLSGSKSQQGVTRETVNLMNLKVFPAGTVLCSCSCTMGATAIASIPLVSNQTFIGILPGPSLSPEYLYYLFQASAEHLNSIGTGAIQTYLSRDDFRALRLPKPSLIEQQNIAAFLDRETGKIDALVEAQRRLIELLKEKRQAVISHAVTKGLDPAAPMKDSGVEWLGEVPAHWEMRSIASCSSRITNGYVGPTRDILFDEGVRYLQSLHIKDGEIRFSPPYFVAPDWSQERAKSVLRLEDVLIVQTGAVGQTAVVTSEFVGCNCHALIIVRPLPEVVKGEFLELQLRSDFGQQSLASVQTGALHPHLNCGTVKLLRMPVPPVAEQRLVIAAVKAALLPLDDLICEAQATIPLLVERRAALISAAVTGKIDVRAFVTDQPERDAA